MASGYLNQKNTTPYWANASSYSHNRTDDWSGESQAEAALCLISDPSAMRDHVRAHGCFHSIPRHLKDKLPRATELVIFKDGTSIWYSPKKPERAMAMTSDETLKILKPKPTPNEAFNQLFALRKIAKIGQKIMRMGPNF